MRISDWSSDVCSSDLRSRRTDLQFLLRPVRRLCISIDTRGRHGRRKRSPARRTAPLSGNSERSWPPIHIVGTQKEALDLRHYALESYEVDFEVRADTPVISQNGVVTPSLWR